MYNDAHEKSEKSWQVYGEYMMHGLAQNSYIYTQMTAQAR